MKSIFLKSLMLFIALMASYQSNVNAQNAFAYDISASTTSDPSVCQVKYSLNASASAVVIEVYNNSDKNTKLFEVRGTTAAGANTVNVSFMNKNVPLGTYWFKIKVTSTNVTTPTLNAKKATFWSPFGIAIDNNPESKHFGRILVTEANTSLPNTNANYPTATAGGGIGVGIYAFDPLLNGIKNSKGTYGFTGGLTMSTSSDKYSYAYNGTTFSYQVLDFNEIKYSEDYSRLFVARGCVKYPGVYELDPDNLEAGAKSIFSGTINTTTGQITNGSTVVSGATHGMDVYGSGDDLKIAVFSINNGYDINYVGESANAYVYNLGRATSWSSSPSLTLPIDDYSSYNASWTSNEYSGILFDKDGKGVFVHQGRDIPGSMSGSTGTTDKYKDYSYIHVNLTNNTADYADLTKYKVAVMAWNHDKTLLAIQNLDYTISATTGSAGKNATDGDYYYDASGNLQSGNAGRIKIYRATYNNNGAHLVWGEPIYSIRTGAGKNINALEWDYANNLYYCSNGGEYVSSIAIPRESGDVTTPARSEVTFDLEAIGASDVQAMGVKTNAATLAKSIDVTWKAPVHGSVASYEVQYKTSQGGWTSLSSSVTSTNYTMNLPTDAQVGETYTFSIIPTFTTGEVGASAQSNTVTDYAPSTPIDITAHQQTVDGKYSFNLAINANINSTNITKTTCYGVNALDLAKYYTVIIPQSLAETATNSTDANGNELTIHYGSIPVADEGVVKAIDNCYYVQVEANPIDKSMPTVIFHNVDPQATYDIDVYLNNATTENEMNATGWTYLKFTYASVASNVMVMPGTSFTFGNASIVTIDENPVSTTNDDMPMGSFRQVSSDVPTNPVSYNKANYIATSGSVVQTLNVTDEVLENWVITYDIDLIHGSSTHQYDGIPAGNTQIAVDFAYLPIDYSIVEGKDNRYYNRATNNTNFTAKVDVNYTRKNSDNTITITGSIDETNGKLELSPTELVPAVEIISNNGVLLKKTSTHYDDNCEINGGYFKTYYDAAVQLTWDTPAAYHLIGYYVNALQNGNPLHCWGHYLSDAEGNRVNDQWIEFVQGSVLTDNQIAAINTNVLNGIGYSGSENWSELASAGSLPLYAHYVYATNADDMLNGESAAINVWVSADYPILIRTKPQIIVSGAVATDDSTPTMTVISSVPSAATAISLTNQDITTGVENIIINHINGSIKYYNLQGVEVDSPTNGVFIKIEGQKATKVIIK